MLLYRPPPPRTTTTQCLWPMVVYTDLLRISQGFQSISQGCQSISMDFRGFPGILENSTCPGFTGIVDVRASRLKNLQSPGFDILWCVFGFQL